MSDVTVKIPTNVQVSNVIVLVNSFPGTPVFISIGNSCIANEKQLKLMQKFGEKLQKDILKLNKELEKND